MRLWAAEEKCCVGDAFVGMPVVYPCRCYTDVSLETVWAQVAVYRVDTGARVRVPVQVTYTELKRCEQRHVLHIRSVSKAKQPQRKYSITTG